MEALFACTKCHSRHPFEELSDGEQLCKDCRNNYPIVKCTFCRTEFQQEDKTSTNSICKKCAFNVKTYGKPSACEYCSIIAAFIGSKCQRCTNSEKKYGTPLQCEQCKQQCAFDRKDDSKKKVEGRMLCWMCTITFRRVLAKNRHKTRQDQMKRRDDSLQNTPLSSSGNTPNKGTPSVTPSANHAPSSESQPHHQRSKDKDRHHHRHHHKDKHRKREHHRSESKEEEGADKEADKKAEGAIKGNKENGDSVAKKAKVEKGAANGLSRSSSPGTSFNDFSSSEHMILITQLREEVEAVKKLSALKEQSILDRDMKITELKAQNFEAEKNMRGKVQLLQKEHNQAHDNLQVKIRDLQRQVASLSKTNRKAERSLERVVSNSQLQHLQAKVEQEQPAPTESHASNTPVMNSEFT